MNCRKRPDTGINKINVDTDIRLAVTRNMEGVFRQGRKAVAVRAIYELLESKKSSLTKVFLTPIMDTVMTRLYRI
ncbi:MAG: hypothetical protein ACLTBV_07210 [Enterocloster bolteae]